MKHVLYSLFLFVFVSAYSQPNVDSLWGVWINPEQSDSNRLLAIHKIAWNGYLHSNPDTAIYFAQLEYEYAETIGYIYFMATARNTQGAASYLQSKYEKALLFFKKSQNIFKTLNDKRGIAACYNNIGGIYDDQGKYDKSLFSYQKGLKIFEELADKKGIANCFNNIGIIYNNQENYHEALNYYQKSLNIKDEIGDKSGKTGSYLNIGHIYFSLKNYEQALNYNNKGLKLAEEIGNKHSTARFYNNIGNIYYEQSNYKQGLIYFKKSIKIKEELGDKKGIASSYINIGNIYFRQEKYSSAISFGKKALSIAQEIGVVYETKNASKLLYKGYNKTGDSQKALVMYESFVKMKDSILNTENTKALIQQRYQYEYEKKAYADSLRNSELVKTKDLQLKAQKEKLQQEKIKQYGLVALSMLFVCLIITIVLYHRNFKKQKLSETENLLSQVELFKADNVLRKANKSLRGTKFQINKEGVNALTDNKLNESDWKILMLICDSPTISNKEVAKEVFLSLEGVRSSFKKMYDLFEVKALGRNKKLALIIKVIKNSEELSLA